MFRNISLLIIIVSLSGFLYGMENENEEGLFCRFEIRDDTLVQIIANSPGYREQKVKKNGKESLRPIGYKMKISKDQIEAINNARRDEGWPVGFPVCLKPSGQKYFNEKTANSFKEYFEKYYKERRKKWEGTVNIGPVYLFALIWGLRLRRHGNDYQSIYFTLDCDEKKKNIEEPVKFENDLAKAIYAGLCLNEHKPYLVWERITRWDGNRKCGSEFFEFIALVSSNCSYDKKNRELNKKNNYHIRIAEGGCTKVCQYTKDSPDSNIICPKTMCLLKILSLPCAVESLGDFSYRFLSDTDLQVENRPHCLGCSCVGGIGK